MAYQSVFRRYELKYLLTLDQKNALLQTMEPYMKLDKYGRSTIRNIYFDTDSYRLIRRSIEKPLYKEKLRIRSYTQAEEESTAFVELKKKYDGVVYKRRMSLPYRQSVDWVTGNCESPIHSQISDEIDYFLKYYGGVVPAMFLSYEREAFFCRGGSDFRVTFDDRILARNENIALTEPVYGTPLLEEGMVLLEIKCSGGIPLWMTEFLSRHKIYKTSFSKYGKAYEKLVFPHLHPNFLKQHEEDLLYV